jgi:hypothetical protein
MEPIHVSLLACRNAAKVLNVTPIPIGGKKISHAATFTSETVTSYREKSSLHTISIQLHDSFSQLGGLCFRTKRKLSSQIIEEPRQVILTPSPAPPELPYGLSNGSHFGLKRLHVDGRLLFLKPAQVRDRHRHNRKPAVFGLLPRA